MCLSLLWEAQLVSNWLVSPPHCALTSINRTAAEPGWNLKPLLSPSDPHVLAVAHLHPSLKEGSDLPPTCVSFLSPSPRSALIKHDHVSTLHPRAFRLHILSSCGFYLSSISLDCLPSLFLPPSVPLRWSPLTAVNYSSDWHPPRRQKLVDRWADRDE